MDNFSLVIFGITSNLAQIKLIPTLYDLVAGDSIKSDFQIIGVGRTVMDQAQFSLFVDQVLHTPNRHHTHEIDPTIQAKLMSHLTYLSADLTDISSYQKLAEIMDSKYKNRMYYLATFPSLYTAIFNNLKNTGLTEQNGGWTRLLIEKPIGTDRDSAKQVNELLCKYFTEDQIFRLDHYLGKETLQNILTFRFGNGIFEPLMNPQFVDYIEVTAAEDFGIGLRGSYYDQNGAIKDVGQNHLLQMIALATMDAPASYSTKDIMAKRIEAITSLVPLKETLITGQYASYLSEKDVDPHSMHETYFSFETKLTRTKLAGIPIFVRGGKCLKRTATEISIIFKKSETRVLDHLGGDPNVLIYRIQPNEGIVLKLLTKVPGHEFKIEESYMQYCYPRGVDLPDAYERLIVDALRGDQTFFNDAVEVDAQWAFTDQLTQNLHQNPPTIYEKGSWGPSDTHIWLEPSTAFCSV